MPERGSNEPDADPPGMADQPAGSQSSDHDADVPNVARLIVDDEADAVAPDQSSPSVETVQPRRSTSGGAGGFNIWHMAGQMYAVGWEVIGAIIGLGLLGYAIDYFVRDSVTPGWPTITGMLLGLIGGLYNGSKRAMLVLGRVNRTPGTTATARSTGRRREAEPRANQDAGSDADRSENAVSSSSADGSSDENGGTGPRE